jgi:hypothetical protein
MKIKNNLGLLALALGMGACSAPKASLKGQTPAAPTPATESSPEASAETAPDATLVVEVPTGKLVTLTPSGSGFGDLRIAEGKLDEQAEGKLDDQSGIEIVDGSPTKPRRKIRDLINDYESKNAVDEAELLQDATLFATAGAVTAAAILAENTLDLMGRLGRAMQAAGADMFVGATHDLRQKLYAVQENREAIAKATEQFNAAIGKPALQKLQQLNDDLASAQAAYNHSKSVMARQGALVVSQDFKILGLEAESKRIADAEGALKKFWKVESLMQFVGNDPGRANAILKSRSALRSLTPVGEELGRDLARATQSTIGELGRSVRRFIGNRIMGTGLALEQNRGVIRRIALVGGVVQIVYAGGLILSLSANEDQALIQVREELNGSSRDLGTLELPVPAVESGAGSVELPTP